MAEKFQAIVALGVPNTRMKDFYDLWAMAQRMPFQGPRLQQALQATFHHRRTPVSTDPPLALTAEFSDDATKQTQWQAFLTRSGLTAPTLPDVIAQLQAFLIPPMRSIEQERAFEQGWRPGGPWKSHP